MYTINHRRDSAGAKGKRRVAPEDEEEETPDVAEALPPQARTRAGCEEGASSSFRLVRTHSLAEDLGRLVGCGVRRDHRCPVGR